MIRKETPADIDELDAPLRGAKTGKRFRLPWTAPQILTVVLGATAAGMGLWTMFATDPYGGEPVAIAPTMPSSDFTQRDRNIAAAIQSGSGPQPVGSGVQSPAAKSPEPPPPGSKTVTIIDGSSGKRQEVVLPMQGHDAVREPATPAGGQSAAQPGEPKDARPAGGAQDSRSQFVDPKLLEQTRHGAIPKIAADGTRPSAAFSRPVKIDDSHANLPRVAIIVGSLGVSASGTTEALERLPAEITLAFTPYGTDPDRLAGLAASRSHELLLQVPMEPFDYPDNDPGPQTLLISLGADRNIDRLRWQMSRLRGYVGVIGFMGGRFTTSETALEPVMRETAKRGLIFVDNGASQRSVASQIAGSQNLPFTRADVVIDAVPTPAEISRALSRLELIARERGSAVGIAAALPAAVSAISDWARKAENRGVVLVPISMVALKAKQS